MSSAMDLKCVILKVLMIVFEDKNNRTWSESPGTADFKLNKKRVKKKIYWVISDCSCSCTSGLEIVFFLLPFLKCSS